MIKKGDTLIEVTLAVGIFSMIAIAITSVMSGGTSSAQTALETTLAREEIDSQAEALRFIHSSYIVDKNSADQKYANLWKKITEQAYTFNSEAETGEKLLRFTPSTCKELYDSNGSNTIFTQKAFIINTRKLSSFTDEKDVLITANGNSDIFKQATTYPRIIYNRNVSTQNNLLDSGRDTEIFKVEGIYIVAVKEAEKSTGSSNTTTIVTDDDIKNQSAFYDFYIRTCWYGSDANLPSTISTVIRLYDPDVISTKD